MKLYHSLLFSLIVIGFSFLHETKADLTFFGEPDDFFVLNDTTLLVYNSQKTNQEVCLINMQTADVKNCIRKGRGPGEVSGLAMRFFINRKERTIYIWDGGNKTLSLFSFDLALLKTIPRPSLSEIRGARYRVPLGNGDEFVSTFKVGLFGYYYSASNNDITPLSVDSELIKPAKENPLLLQGDYAVDWQNHAMVFVTEFSSVVFKLKNAEIDFLTLGKPNLPFPENDVESGFALPRMSTYTFASIDVSIDNNHIYVLHSGKKPTRRKTIWFELRDRLEEYAYQLLESETILVYDLENGEYIKSIHLPENAIKAKVYNGKAYSLVRGKEDAVLKISDI